MAAFALSELLPNKWRHIGVVLADAAVLVAVILAPVSARYGWEYGTWKWNFYTGAILQGLSFIGLFTLYFPPAHPYNLEPKQVIKKLDYLGKKCQASERQTNNQRQACSSSRQGRYPFLWASSGPMSTTQATPTL